MTDPRLDRPTWRGRTNVDALTISCVERAEAIGGHEFVVTQGSYQAGAGDPNSAGIHDMGGAVDLRWCGHDRCVLALREVGMAAWHRTEQQGNWAPHIHAVVIDHPLLAPSARRQVLRYLAGRNGLANDLVDDGPRLNPIPRPVWPPQEDDMFTDEDRATIKEIAKDSEKARAGSFKRDKDFDARLKKIEAALEALMKQAQGVNLGATLNDNAKGAGRKASGIQ